MGERVVSKKAVLDRVDKNRRGFVKKALIGTAFAAPLMASFRMDSLSVGSARACTVGNQGDGGGFLQWLICYIKKLFGLQC